MSGESTFHEQWPRLQRSLHAHLARRGVPASWRDDIVQDTSIRLFRSWERLDKSTDLLPLARVIANRLLCDESKRHTETPLAELRAGGEVQSAEAHALARLELQDTLDLVGRLTPAERRAVLAEIGEADRPRVVTSAFKMARSRGRRNLRALMERAAMAFVPARVLALRMQRRLGEPGYVSQLFASGAQLTAVVGISVAIGTGGSPLGPDAPGPRLGSQTSEVARLAAARSVGDAARPETAPHRGPRGGTAERVSAPASPERPAVEPPGRDRADRPKNHSNTTVGSTGATVSQRGSRVSVVVCPGDPGQGYEPCDESRGDAIVVVVSGGSEEGPR
jgi:DNA-directed RNA polymerase specialized sigma24 family protein